MRIDETTIYQFEEPMKTVTEYEIINHGIDHSDYFQGCGVSCTRYTDVATGIGCSEKDALDDALDQLAQAAWDVENNKALMHDLHDLADATDVIAPIIAEFSEGDEDYENPWVHVSVRVK